MFEFVVLQEVQQTVRKRFGIVQQVEISVRSKFDISQQVAITNVFVKFDVVQSIEQVKDEVIKVRVRN